MKNIFSNGETHIQVKTVGEAIKELSLLDPNLPMDQGYDGEGSDLVVMNAKQADAHLHIDDGGFGKKI